MSLAGTKFVWVMSAWPGEASVSVIGSLPETLRPRCVCKSSTLLVLKEYPIRGPCDNLPHTHITTDLLLSLCMDFNKHHWKDELLDFSPIRARSAIIKGKPLNSPFEIDQTKKSTLPFLTRIYSSIRFAAKRKPWYHRLMIACMFFYPSRFLSFLKARLLDLSERQWERDTRHSDLNIIPYHYYYSSQCLEDRFAHGSFYQVTCSTALEIISTYQCINLENTYTAPTRR